MQLQLSKKQGVPIQKGMIGLFFEDINYAADGGLYAEMIENRSFEFVEAFGQARDYYTVFDGDYAWKAYISEKSEVEGCTEEGTVLPMNYQVVTGSPHTTDNPHYMRVETTAPMCGLCNQAYEGISLKQGMGYGITFWARCVDFTGNFVIGVEKDGKRYAQGRIAAAAGVSETYNYFRKYELEITADASVSGAAFVLCMDTAGIVEFDYISMFPKDAVAGLFRKDLFEKLKALKPGFLRFPGGCIVEGNTLDNRYRFKDSLKEPWARKSNWNRWAVHGNCEENSFKSVYSHYNQTLGLGYYEYFLLCELIGAEPLPVVNVGFACQYQSTEQVAIDSPEFEAFLQESIDLLEFANGGVDTKWGAVRAQMGHEAPFNLKMLGVGNEQWQTQRADFFERYTVFEQRIHEYDASIKLIGSAGPDITSERYTKAWEFYHAHGEQENFVYAVDEHYYVKPEWLLEHTDFYDNYPRDVKVFSGEYAAHPISGMNRPDANTLEGALAEAAFLTGVERNADVVVLASYAPLFARLGYAQWSPDMIWFDGENSYATPSYYVQQMYGANMGDVTLDLQGQEKELAKQGIYLSASCYTEGEDAGTVILKVVNTNSQAMELELVTTEENGLGEGKKTSFGEIQGTILTGKNPKLGNTIMEPERIKPYEKSFGEKEALVLQSNSFGVYKMKFL